MKVFNTTAVCIPDKHYMVDITDRVKAIKEFVDAGKYFTINRARQYGKTTTLNTLNQLLSINYTVISLSFEGIDKDVFESGATFSQAIARLIIDSHEFENAPVPEETLIALEQLNASEICRVKMDDLIRIIKRWIKKSSNPIILIIDEVDAESDNQVFLDFLAQLRDGYISRDTKGTPAFQSVILAGVTDVKHLKGKIRSDDNHKLNSPWNIAADFDIDMSLSEAGIKGMLDEYEADHHTGMNTAYMAKLIWEETSGYPFLVSRYCQLIDERVCQTIPPSEAWTKNGFMKANKLLLAENNSLFQSLTEKLDTYPKLKAAIRSILMDGTKLTYNAQTDAISQMQMYGLIRNDNNTVMIANRTFETLLYNLFTSEEEMNSNVFFKSGTLDKNKFVQDSRLNMEAVLNGFIKTYNQVFGPLEDRFKEKDGRELFLLYLKPIINGTGNYYIEAQTRDQTRTDVIVDYCGEQFIIELKIWRGARYNSEGEKQISQYLDYFDLDTGYMLSFNFNKEKHQGIKEVEINGKKLIEATL